MPDISEGLRAVIGFCAPCVSVVDEIQHLPSSTIGFQQSVMHVGGAAGLSHILQDQSVLFFFSAFFLQVDFYQFSPSLDQHCVALNNFAFLSGGELRN